MSIGYGHLLCLPYADNGVISKPRTFLSIKEENGYLHLLNVSSVKGKEHQLFYDSNVEIQKYNPPFKLKSMAKLNALYKVELCPELNRRIVCRRQTLDSGELQRIITLHADYISKNQVLEVLTSAAELKGYLSN